MLENLSTNSGAYKKHKTLIDSLHAYGVTLNYEIAQMPVLRKKHHEYSYFKDKLEAFENSNLIIFAFSGKYDLNIK